jgi:hypothetical protein
MATNKEIVENAYASFATVTQSWRSGATRGSTRVPENPPL